jgi:hypothetical protein
MKNNIENIIHANMKFIMIQASIIIACCQDGLFHKLYSAQFSFNNFNICCL